MLRPSIFNNHIFNHSFDDLFETNFWPEEFIGKENAMSTDISESENEYRIDMELPGFSKENINAELKDGYMTVTASRTEEKNEENEKTHYIHKERYSGSYSRSFYVGKDVTEEDINAKFADGVLSIIVPKKEKTPEVEQKRFIAIEG